MKRIQSHLVVAFMFVFIANLGMSQVDKKEKIEQLKIAFITNELHLTSEEAEKFWPVYNEMSDKLRVEKKKQRSLAKEMKEKHETYSEADYNKTSSTILQSQIDEAQLKKQYHDKIAGIIGYKKATKLLSLEQRFKRELLNRVKKENKKPHVQPGGPMQQD